MLSRTAERTADQTAQMSILDTEVDTSLQQLKKADTLYGKSLQFTPDGLAQRKRTDASWQNVAAQWAEIKTGTHDPLLADIQHEAIIANVRMMITHAGDTSNLALDSDLDSYYLIDATLNGLPQTEDRLTSIKKLSQDSLVGGTINADARISLAVIAGLLREADHDRIMGDLQTSLNEDHNFHGISPTLQSNLPPVIEAYTKASDELQSAMLGLVAHPDAPFLCGTVRHSYRSSSRNELRRRPFSLWYEGARRPAPEAHQGSCSASSAGSSLDDSGARLLGRHCHLGHSLGYR